MKTTSGPEENRTLHKFLAREPRQPWYMQAQITLSSYNLHSHRVILSGSTSLLGRSILAIWMQGLFGPFPLTIITVLELLLVLSFTTCTPRVGLEGST